MICEMKDFTKPKKEKDKVTLSEYVKYKYMYGIIVFSNYVDFAEIIFEYNF